MIFHINLENPSLLAGGDLEMLQTWVALPEQHEESNPTFKNYRQNKLPVYSDKGLWIRIIAGEALGARSNVSTLSPLFYLHVTLTALSKVSLPQHYCLCVKITSRQSSGR